MQISDLSLREQIALDVLSAFAWQMPDSLALAFNLADEFMKACGRRRDEITEAKAQVEKAELSADLLRSMNNDGQFGARIALEQIWEFLGVVNQTDAMQRLNKLQDHYNDRA